MRVAAVLTALSLVLGVAASPALADDEPAKPMSTADQIDAFLKSSPALDASVDSAVESAVDGVVPRDDRKAHGEVAVGVGTGGYRSVYMRSDMPIGQSGRLSVAIEDTRYGRAYPYRFHGGPGGLGVVDRQRCGLEAVGPARPLDAMGGPHGRCGGRGPGW